MTTLPNPLVTSLTVGIAGICSKAFLNFACKTQVVGLEHLLNAWKEENRVGRGILTVSNHISVLDDPLMWGILPIRSFFNNRQSRWTLGARDILFTRPSHAVLFRSGKVIDTVRGVGVYQDAIDLAIQRLDVGDWVHIFPQGYVRQETSKPPIGRLKWGIGRILAECRHTPNVMPMWINGFGDVMPADRSFKYLPRPASLQIVFEKSNTLTPALEKRRAIWNERLMHHRHAREKASSFHADLAAIVEHGLDSLGNRVHPLINK